MPDNLTLLRNGSIATLRLNRPEVKNALDASLLQNLKSTLDALATDKATRALVITGDSDAFSSGADLKGSLEPGKSLGDLLEAHYHPLVESLISFPAPTIAVIEGVATGAGLSLALLCDIALAKDDARLSLKFSQIGLVPDTGATFTVPQRIGHARASYLMLTGEEISGAEAAAIGLVARACGDDIWQIADELAERLASGPTAAYMGIRQALLASGHNSLQAQLGLEAMLQTKAGETQDFAEAIRAFMEKRPPRFAGK